MKLPSGYTQLEYLRSSGTQYIDTGFVPNSLTRIVIVGLFHSGHSLYGTSESGKNLNMTSNGSTVYYKWNGAGDSAKWSYMGVVHQYEQDKNVCKIDGNTVHTYTYSSWAATTTVLLFARNHNTAGPNDMGDVRVYSCKLYDNGVLVRDFVPCRNLSGTLGMYDLVNNKFYTNAGSGTFSIGAVGTTYWFGRTLIGGTAYNIKSGKTLIGSTAYTIKHGKTLVEGTVYKI